MGVEFAKDRMGEHHEAYGTMRLHIDDKVVAEAEMRTIASRFSLCGEGLCVGYDGATPSAPSTPHGASSPGARSSRS